MNSTNASITNNSVIQPTCPLPTMDTTADKAMKIASLCAIMFFALTLNSLVITVFAKNPSLHKTVNYFLVNMAVSDLLTPIVLIPKKLVILITGSFAWRVTGTTGSILCKLQPLLADLAPSVSILCIVCITVDRLYAVMRPLRITMIPDKARVFLIGLTWLLSILYYVHYFHSLRLFTAYNGETYCIMDWGLDHVKSTTILVTFTAVFYGVLPWILVVVLYVFMLVGLKRAKVRIEANAQTLTRHRRITSVTRQVFVIVLVFAICNFPSIIMFLIVAYVFKFDTSCISLPYWPNLFFAAEFLQCANAALNPCICLFLNVNYRTALWRLLRLRRREPIHPEIALREEMREEPSTRST